MNGPEHYLEAERLLANGEAEIQAASPRALDAAMEVAELAFAAAQVHATLAHAAATAMRPAGVNADGPTAGQWRQVIVAKRPQPIEVPS